MRHSSAHLQVLARSRLVATRRQGSKVVILDVRPAEEFAARHIPGALPVPQADLDAALARLPRRAEIVAYCRAPYYVLAPQAVERRRGHGYRAWRLVDGLPEWRLAGRPVAAGLGEPR